MEKKPLFDVKSVSKNFGGTTALKDVSLRLNCGEIVGLVGENGAGKSTLLKIIMGVQSPSSGSMTLRGRAYAPSTPREANDLGVGMVFQEQSLITNLTVGQNIFFGNEKRFKRCGLINYKRMYAEAKKVMAGIDIKDLPPEKYVRDLNFATRQMVEISKVVNQADNCDEENAIVLLDEPTSVLNDAEVEQLFAEMRKMADAGHSIVFVSHRLDEVLKITERIYVFKDAQNAGEFVTKDTAESMLYQAMVGSESAAEYYYTQLQRKPDAEAVLEVDKLSMFGSFKDVSFKLRKGEILGLCGVVGSGKEELCYALCGDLPATGGAVRLKGRPVSFNSPADALREGILMVPQERNTEGVMGMLSLTDNIAASSLASLGKAGFLSNKKLRAQAQKWVDRLRIRTSGVKTPADQLSGGNAQKVVFARMLASGCDILLLNHPTRGVDVGAKQEIYRLIREMADEGKSMILLGDTLDECIEMSNRVLVMMDGVLAGEFDASPGGKPEHLDVIQCMM